MALPLGPLFEGAGTATAVAGGVSLKPKHTPPGFAMLSHPPLRDGGKACAVQLRTRGEFPRVVDQSSFNSMTQRSTFLAHSCISPRVMPSSLP